MNSQVPWILGVQMQKGLASSLRRNQSPLSFCPFFYFEFTYTYHYAIIKRADEPVSDSPVSSDICASVWAHNKESEKTKRMSI